MSAISSLKLETNSNDRPAADRGPRSSKHANLHCLAILAGLLLGFAAPATADTLQISGTGLVRHCPCDVGAADDAEVSEGVLQPQSTNTHYFAPVVFPRDGETVCRFSMIYRDVNAADTMTASLKRKVIQNNGPTFDPPTVMATVSSASGTPDTMRRASTTKIRRPAIRNDNSFYFIEVLVPTVNLEIVGFQIEVKPVC